MSREHRLINDTLVREQNSGIFARCICGWSSGPHFSSMSATVAMMNHKEKEQAKRDANQQQH